MKFKIGADEGNRGAIIRWGRYLDNGIWSRLWRFRKLWFRLKFIKGYLNFGLFCIHYGNQKRLGMKEDKMINFIKKTITTYLETEKTLAQMRCLIVDNGQEIRKIIKTFPKKYRKFAMKEAYNLAFWGHPLSKIIDRLIILKVNLK